MGMRYLRLIGLAILLAVAGAAAYWRGGYAAWFLVWFLAGAGLYAVAVSLFCLMQVKVERRLIRDVLGQGDALTVELDIRHTSLLPLVWLSIEDRFHSGSRGGSEGYALRKLVFPWFGGRTVVRYEVTGLRRGAYGFGNSELVTGDLLGFSYKKRSVKSGGANRFVVLPDIRDVRLSKLPRGLGEEEPVLGAKPSLQQNVGITVREYAAGDPLHRIHWKSTARRGELMTRTVEPMEELRLLVCLDAGESAYRGQPALFEKGVSLAAGLLASAAEHRLGTGLAVAGGGRRVLECSGPAGFRDGVSDYLQLLAELAPIGEMSFPHYLLTEAEPAAPAGSTLVCLTPSLTDDLVAVLSSLASRRRPVYLIHLQPRSVPSVGERERKRLLEQAGCGVWSYAEPLPHREVRVYAEEQEHSASA